MSGPQAEDRMKGATEDHWLAHYPPPYRLSSAMLFVAALCPAEPLQAEFLGVPLLVIGDRAVLVTWFSCIRRIHYGEFTAERGQLGGLDEVLYCELNIVALLKERARCSRRIATRPAVGRSRSVTPTACPSSQPRFKSRRRTTGSSLGWKRRGGTPWSRHAESEQLESWRE